MTVSFIGAGPGAPDLITLRGLERIKTADLVLYAGSLVPEEVVAQRRDGVDAIDTAPMDLDAIIAKIEDAHAKGWNVARVHSGDPSIYGAIAEQMRRLDAIGIPYEVVPGVPAFAAMAASLNLELTLPNIVQSVVLTRVSSRASAMPPSEDLAAFARTGATIALHLSIAGLDKIVAELTPILGADCPAIVGHRVSWPDQAFVAGTLADIRDKTIAAGFKRTALILVGKGLTAAAQAGESRLYAAEHTRYLRE
ncbi:MAG: precorrin-4 C(11)-methyltransferase [Alphaproteobacteria bacterium]|nr:precorrin-4 C(11)-methyltransferase [Alphaproteobacteria bacterium]MCA0451990.1 precorrin-4 C(11)-methyltransferase [Pseudomonadota bacterium]